MTRSELTALDLVGASAALLPTAVLLLFPFAVAPSFAKMYQDFGGELPKLTMLALQPLPPLLLGLVPLAMVALSMARPKASLGVRRALIAGAFLAGAGLCTALWWALYQPVFELAGSIQ